MTEPSTRRLFPGLLLCLAVSGMSGLIYEVVWMRSLELIFGTTSFAIATVLASFMGGLALGSFGMAMAARRLGRFDPLRVYGAIECLVGAAGLLVPLALRLILPLHQMIGGRFQDSFALLTAGRFVLCGAVLLVPTALMGATLPIVSRLAEAGDEGTGRRVAILYAVNTLGGVVGCAAAGLMILPSIGLRHTGWLAVGLNLVSASGAFLLARWRGCSSDDARACPRPTPGPGAITAIDPAAPADAGPGRAGSVLIALYAVSGATAMVYEIAWSRLLVLVLGSSTYSYTIMLATFLSGLAAGAWLGARARRDRYDPLLAAALCQVFVALTTYLSLTLVRELPYLYVLARDRLHPSPSGLLGVQLTLAAALMILPTLGLGAMFSITMTGINPRGERAPRVVGVAYAWNTFGAIAGSLAGGFWLIPRLGSRGALAAGIAVSALLAIPALATTRSSLRPGLRAAFACAVVALALDVAVDAPPLPAEILSSGVFRYADRYSGLDRARFFEAARANHGDILYFKEGLTCTVTVFRTTSAQVLLVNGKPDASVPPGLAEPFGRRGAARLGDLPTQVLVAQIPMLLAPRPDEVLVIGLGSGVTLGSTLAHPVRRVDCAELESAVVEGSRFFDAESGAPLRDPRVRLVVDDARNHLLLTGRRYDVIISEPSNPWVAGASSLFTRDFFDRARSRLAPDGLFCQWVQLYELTVPEFQAILRGFASVFREVHVFRVATDAILIGTNGSAPLRLERILERGGPRVVADLERVGIHAPADLIAHYWVGGAELRQSLGPGPLNTDDNMLIEFAAPLHMLARNPAEQETEARALASMFSGRTTGIASHVALPGVDRAGQSAFYAGLAASAVAQGYADFGVLYARRSLELERNPAAARAYGEALAKGGLSDEARKWLRSAVAEFPRDPGLLRALVGIERGAQDWPAVRRDARTLTALEPQDRAARYWLGESLFRADDRAAALATLEPLAPADWSAPTDPHDDGRDGPGADDSLADLGLLIGSLQYGAGRPEAAIAPLRRHLRLHPGDRRAREMLAEALERTDRTREAEAERRRLATDAAEQAAARLERAKATWDAGPPDRVAALLEEAREFEPDGDEITFLLARARVRSGSPGRAARLLEEFLETNPDRPWAVGYLGQIDAADGRAERSRLLAERYTALTGRRWEAIVER